MCIRDSSGADPPPDQTGPRDVPGLHLDGIIPGDVKRPQTDRLAEHVTVLFNNTRSCRSPIANGGAAVSARRKLLCSTDDCPTAVSYTHLRAHETVLEIVCRLLLEKK